MCTVTWWREPAADAFGVWFNRDERRTRPASEPVQRFVTPDGTSYLAPRDPTAGGTWLLANARGLVIGVLNHYAAAARLESAPARSRGLLPLQLGAGADVAVVAENLSALNPADFAPFILVAWDRVHAASWTWDGARLERDDAPALPLTTSSHRTDEICAWRRARYAALVAQPDRGALAAFHEDTAHPDPAFNVRMRRPDARTESVCRVTVTPGEVCFWHRREAPDAIAARDEQEQVLTRT